MIAYNKITYSFDLISKICAVMTAMAIVLSTAATSILFPVTAVFSLIAGGWRNKFNLIIRNPITLAFLLFYTLLLVGMFYTTAPWGDVLLVLRRYSKFIFAIFFIPLFTEERWRNYAVNAFLFAVVLMLITSTLRDFGWITCLKNYGSIEVFRFSIEYSLLLAFAAYLVLLRVVEDSRYRWLWVILLLYVIYMLIFRCIGRTGIVVFIVLLNLFFIKRIGFKGLLLGVLISILLLGAAYKFSDTFESRLKQASDDVKIYNQNDKTSVGLRITFLKDSIRLFKTHPIFGTGTGSFTHEYAAIQPTPSVLTTNPHNEYMHIAVQFGILGVVVLLLFFFGIPVWYCDYLPAKFRDIAQGIIVAITVGSLANSWLLDTTPGHCYAYFMVLSFAAWPICIRKR